MSEQDNKITLDTYWQINPIRLSIRNLNSIETFVCYVAKRRWLRYSKPVERHKTRIKMKEK